MLDDKTAMALALNEAENAYRQNEVPVGAVLIDGKGEVIASTHNLCEQNHDPSAHAEMLAVRYACQNKKYLSDCTLYVTMEPCPMCAGALVHARVGRVVYGVRDVRQGAFGSVMNLNDYPLESKVKTDCLDTPACKDILTRFFTAKRQLSERK